MTRVLYFDKLNILSCLAVVLLHANGFVHSYIKDNWWWLHVLIEVICYFGVPVFFMLSGAKLLGYTKKYSTVDFYKKRFIKTVIPYILWTIFFYNFSVVLLHYDFRWQNFIEDLTTGHIPLTNYWFFIPLFFLYLFMPFFSKLVLNLNQRFLVFLCILLIIFQSILPTLYYTVGLSFNPSLPIAGFAVYLFLGYLIANYDLEKQSSIFWSVGIIALLSLLFRYCYVFNNTQKDLFLFTYLGVYAIFPAIFIFMAAKKWGKTIKRDTNNEKQVEIWSWLSSKTFGIYLLHMFFIRVLSFRMSSQSPWFILISFIVALGLSFIITSGLQKYKYTRFLVP